MSNSLCMQSAQLRLSRNPVTDRKQQLKVRLLHLVEAGEEEPWNEVSDPEVISRVQTTFPGGII